MIKNIKIRINVDQRGAITCGSLVGGRPKGLDHFDLAPFPELRAVYGDKPRSLVIYLPSDDLMSCFDCEYSAWGKAPSGPVKKRICDGEECLHRVRETIGAETFGAGELSPCVCENLSEDDPAHCRYSAHLKAYVADPESRSLISPVCYVLRTHSSNSGDAVYSELQKVFSLTSMLFGEPRLTGIPFLLSVAMVSRRDDAGRKFPIWRIQALTFEMPSGASMLGGNNQPNAARTLSAAPQTQAADPTTNRDSARVSEPRGEPTEMVRGKESMKENEKVAEKGTRNEKETRNEKVAEKEMETKNEKEAKKEIEKEKVIEKENAATKMTSPPTAQPDPLSDLLAEVESLGQGLFGEQWSRKKSDGALKVSDGATSELTALATGQLQELRGILQRSLQERE